MVGEEALKGEDEEEAEGEERNLRISLQDDGIATVRNSSRSLQTGSFQT